MKTAGCWACALGVMSILFIYLQFIRKRERNKDKEHGRRGGGRENLLSTASLPKCPQNHARPDQSPEHGSQLESPKGVTGAQPHSHNLLHIESGVTGT